MRMAQGLRGDISLTQLRYFIRAAELGSMSKAAESLFVAQSAVSTSIANLERNLGATLFVRQRAKGLELTAAGHQFLAGARLVMRTLESAVHDVDPRELMGEFRVGCFPTLIPFWMPTVCSVLATTHPGLTTQVEEVNMDDILETLRTGRLEVALAYRFTTFPAWVSAIDIGTLPMHAIVGSDHPLADRGEVSIAELAREWPYIMLQIPGSSDYFQRAIDATEQPVEVLHRVSNYEAVRSMVARSNGFSLLNQMPHHETTYDGGRLRCLRLTDAPPPLGIVCIHRSDRQVSRKGQAFVDACLEVAPALLATIAAGARDENAVEPAIPDGGIDGGSLEDEA